MDFMPSGMAFPPAAEPCFSTLNSIILNRRSRQFFILHSTFFIHLPPLFISILCNIYYKTAKNVAINEKELYFCNARMY